MAITVSTNIASGWPMQSIDGRQMTLVKATFDDSYDAGGDALVAADCGMTRIDAVIVLGLAVASDGLTSAAVSYDHSAGKLQGFISADAAVNDEAGETDLDGLSVRLLILGAL